MPALCPHMRRQFMRVISRDGREQIAEVCQDCHENARGAGIWVSAHKVPVARSSLPVWRDLRTPEDKGEQPMLDFNDEEA